MSIKYKLLLLVITAIAIPVVTSLTIINHFSEQTREETVLVTRGLVESDIQNILASLSSLAENSRASIDQQRKTAVKNYLRASADDLLRKIELAYTTLPAREALSVIRKEVLAVKIGRTGYAFGMNRAGSLTIHPSQEGKNLSGETHIDRMRKDLDGFITYYSVTAKRDKAAYFRYFEPLDLIIAPGVFIDELETLYDREGEESIINTVKQEVASRTIGKDGFAWIAEINEGKPSLIAVDARYRNQTEKSGFISTVASLAQRTGNGGSVSLKPAGSGADTSAETTLSALAFTPYNWLIGVSVPEKHFRSADQALTASFSTMHRFILIGALAISLLVLAISLVFSHRVLVQPIRQVVSVVGTIATGDYSARLNADSNDEFGHLGKAIDRMTEGMDHKAELARTIAGGDLSRIIDLTSEHDSLGLALKDMSDSLNTIINQIQEAAMQVATGADEVSASSQSLSQGATEQAASLEEISSSMVEMESQTRLNAESAQQANRMAQQAKTTADKGNQQMSVMVNAMRDISLVSQEIHKITKVIDEIAFQTNLLALNAAVEAARAGRYGKGFAVVAEEVRSLANRSSTAAKEIGDLIENTIDKIEAGSAVSVETAGLLSDIQQAVADVSGLVTEIARASSEQAQGISQVNQGLGQIDTVTQQNTANAEETASASEELSAQATYLQEILTKFQLRGSLGEIASRNNSAIMTSSGRIDRPSEILLQDNENA